MSPHAQSRRARKSCLLKAARYLTADWSSSPLPEREALLVLDYLAKVWPASLFRADPQELEEEDVWVLVECVVCGDRSAARGVLTPGALLRAFLATPGPWCEVGGRPGG